MTDDFEIPAFLRRTPTPTGVAMTTAPAAAVAPAKSKQKRKDALMAIIKVSIPIDTNDPSSYPEAVKAVQQMRGGLPENAKFTVTSTMGKI